MPGAWPTASGGVKICQIKENENVADPHGTPVDRAFPPPSSRQTLRGSGLSSPAMGGRGEELGFEAGPGYLTHHTRIPVISLFTCFSEPRTGPGESDGAGFTLVAFAVSWVRAGALSECGGETQDSLPLPSLCPQRIFLVKSL